MRRRRRFSKRKRSKRHPRPTRSAGRKRGECDGLAHSLGLLLLYHARRAPSLSLFLARRSPSSSTGHPRQEEKQREDAAQSAVAAAEAAANELIAEEVRDREGSEREGGAKKKAKKKRKKKAEKSGRGTEAQAQVADEGGAEDEGGW